VAPAVTILDGVDIFVVELIPNSPLELLPTAQIRPCESFISMAPEADVTIF
jgi:hypothetical protein